MKFSLSMILVCLIAFTFGFKDDQKPKYSNEINEYNKPIVITISLDSSGEGLILDDGENKGGKITTKVYKKQIVRWELEKKSGIESLDDIYTKSGNVFEIKPSKGSDNKISGTIGDFPSGTEEEYGIRYTVNGQAKDFDPKIQIH
jgi:hypothetical protein